MCVVESLGMRVIFYDIENLMPLGNAKKCDSLEELLQQADFVTLHVPKTDLTRDMIGEKQIMMMKKGSYLLNASRGSVVPFQFSNLMFYLSSTFVNLFSLCYLQHCHVISILEALHQLYSIYRTLYLYHGSHQF
jgi:hypothetical protein